MEEKIVKEGWVARDNGDDLFLYFTNKPYRVYLSCVGLCTTTPT